MMKHGRSCGFDIKPDISMAARRGGDCSGRVNHFIFHFPLPPGRASIQRHPQSVVVPQPSLSSSNSLRRPSSRATVVHQASSIRRPAEATVLPAEPWLPVQQSSSSSIRRPASRAVVVRLAVIVQQHPSSGRSASSRRPAATAVRSAAPYHQQPRSIAQHITILRCRFAWNSPPFPSALNHTIIQPKYEGK